MIKPLRDYVVLEKIPEENKINFIITQFIFIQIS